MTQTLVRAALTAAYLKKKPKLGLLHHSDCGGQYCSAAYRALQASYAVKMSMSRKGKGWEFAIRRHLHAVQSSHNAPMESFFGTLILKVCLIMVLTLAIIPLRVTPVCHLPRRLKNVAIFLFAIRTDLGLLSFYIYKLCYVSEYLLFCIQSPDLPPCFSSSLISLITMPRSAALHIS